MTAVNVPSATKVRGLSIARLRLVVKIAIGAALLSALYLTVDWRSVGRVLVNLHPGLLAAALCLFVPQTLVSAWRWRVFVSGVRRISLAEALRQTLAASAFNLVVPSKLGDFSKAAMLDADRSRRARAASYVVAEKAADVAALGVLIACGALGMLAWQHAAILVVLAGTALWAQRGAAERPLRRWVAVSCGSIVLWSLHLAQIHLFILAAGVGASWDQSLARVPLAIFAGLLPVSWCGLGTRDAALVVLLADIAPAPTMAAVGLLTALRYLVPGAAGIPWASGVWRERTSLGGTP
ncbi:MAG: flippase-like domain-containing protein [Planctomycetia bacterium]|nr:flippase-like domain-containing protein [Planctomycetia bacterium]